jgi:hypothetical protein
VTGAPASKARNFGYQVAAVVDTLIARSVEIDLVRTQIPGSSQRSQIV